MPLSASIVGATSRPYRHTLDARRLMAYAAGIDYSNPRCFDTTGALCAHPLFPVCLEWDAILEVRHGSGTEHMTSAEQARAVHGEHDLHLFRPLSPGLELTTVATVIAVEARLPGVTLVKRIDTVDAQDRLVCRTYQSTLYRGVALAGASSSLDAAPAWPATLGDPARYLPLSIPRGAAHVYTECARIWNPIHTDIAHARAAGLPDIILHGTATLARAVSLLIDRCLNGEPDRVRRVGCRFSGMVRMPSALVVRIDGIRARLITFSVFDGGGAEVISRGFIEPGLLDGTP